MPQNSRDSAISRLLQYGPFASRKQLRDTVVVIPLEGFHHVGSQCEASPLVGHALKQQPFSGCYGLPFNGRPFHHDHEDSLYRKENNRTSEEHDQAGNEHQYILNACPAASAHGEVESCGHRSMSQSNPVATTGLIELLLAAIGTHLVAVAEARFPSDLHWGRQPVSLYRGGRPPRRNSWIRRDRHHSRIRRGRRPKA